MKWFILQRLWFKRNPVVFELDRTWIGGRRDTRFPGRYVIICRGFLLGDGSERITVLSNVLIDQKAHQLAISKTLFFRYQPQIMVVSPPWRVWPTGVTRQVKGY